MQLASMHCRSTYVAPLLLLAPVRVLACLSEAVWAALAQIAALLSNCCLQDCSGYCLSRFQQMQCQQQSAPAADLGTVAHRGRLVA
jgi:hypothetical protein